jgi:peroxygenase
MLGYLGLPISILFVIAGIVIAARNFAALAAFFNPSKWNNFKIFCQEFRDHKLDDPRGKPQPTTSAIQKHVEFFDKNHDGKITWMETFTGLRELGFNILVAAIGASFVNFSMAYGTHDSWWRPWDPTIHVKNLRFGKHGSDTGIFDKFGNFNEAKFEEIFQKYDLDKDGAFSWQEWIHMTEDNRLANDWFGWIAARFEWGFAYWVAAIDGKMSKERLRGILDGSLFFQIADDVRKTQHVPVKKHTQ